MTIGTDTLAQDNFNRANGNLAGSTMSDGVNTWTALSGTPTIASNKQSGVGSARVTSNSNFADANYSVQAEQYMKGDVLYASDGVDGELRLYARIVDANNYYEAQISSNGGSNGSLVIFINKMVAGSPTTIDSFVFEDEGWTTWRFDVDGTSLKVFGDGGQRGSVTDSTFTAVGYAGIASTGPIGTFSSDNFIVKGTAAGGGTEDGDYSSAGVGAAAAVGSAIFNGVAASAGIATAAAVGTAGESTANASGASTAASVGASVANSVANAAGVSTVVAATASGTLYNPGAINIQYNGFTPVVYVNI